MPPRENARGDGAIGVIIADDHAIVRSGLRMLLDAEGDIEVLAEADDVGAAARYVLGHKPAVLVLDLNMGQQSSLPAIPGMIRRSPRTAIVVLTMQDDPAFAREALGAGARGYVVKHSAGDELLEAVRTAARGETYLSPKLGARLATAARGGTERLDGLSDREVEVLRLVALGHTNVEIAGQLYLSVRTIETHRAHIQQKTRRSSRPELVRYALDRGLVQ